MRSARRMRTRSCSISASISCKWMPACASPTATWSTSCAPCAAIPCSRRAIPPWARSLRPAPTLPSPPPSARPKFPRQPPPPKAKSPTGPHPHVLPNLLRHRRTHAATEPIPSGFVPCGHFYPAHPAKDAFGEVRPYDAGSHDAFQALMRMFGDPQAIGLKQRIAAAISAGDDPTALVEPESRFARTTIRATLRQLLAAEGSSPALLAWQAAYDRAHEEPVGDEDDVAH